MKQCPKCKNITENDSAKFCKKCGRSLEDVPSVDANVTGNQENSHDSHTSNPDISSATYGTQDNEHKIQRPSVSRPPIYNRYGRETEESMPMPKDYMVWSIISILCCTPIGIYALICSSRVEKYYRAGNYHKAQLESNKAKKWSIIATIMMILQIVFWIITFSIAMTLEENTNTYPAESEKEKTELKIENQVENNNLSEKTNKFIQETIAIEKANLPMDMGSGMSLVDMRISGEFVFYDIMCDEDLINVELIEKNNAKNILIANIKESPDRKAQHFFNLCKQAHKGIAYKYKGNNSGKYVIVRIPWEELNEL